MAKQIKTLSFDEFADELLRETQPRALIILASSQVDLSLRNIIEGFLLPKASKAADSDELIDGDNPLSTFSSRIKVCRRLGLIDQDFTDALNKLRQIRNQAAHLIVFGIKESPLKEHIKDLGKMILSRKSYSLTVQKYLKSDSLDDFEKLKAILLTLCVITASIESAIEKYSVRNQSSIKLD